VFLPILSRKWECMVRKVADARCKYNCERDTFCAQQGNAGKLRAGLAANNALHLLRRFDIMIS
jgi:hypothetical protein